ncbi:MAG: peptidyl-prolyl cis-trans isomerase [Odoribacteraceae bacterium]|jgi:hypothetical protein|nr:peptidyl-prolyl cis-trans isomerase [Odoribacteraceae bacterium]
MRYPFIIILLLAVLHACKENSAKDDRPVAKVMNKYLYSSEVEAFIPTGTPRHDSSSIAQSYIRNWIIKELLLAKAIKNLTEEEKKEIRRQVEDYSSSVFIHKYKDKLISQKMDPVISDADIDDYYAQNKINFILTRPVVKALLIIIPRSAPNIASFQEAFRSDNPDALKTLEEYSIATAKKFDDFNNRWVEMRYLLNFLPVDQAAWDAKYRDNRRVELEDNENYYFLRINEVVREHEIAPVGYVKQEIELILRNKRKIEFEENLERQINEEGTRKNLVSIYK